jgi:hypothetical protein
VDVGKLPLEEGEGPGLGGVAEHVMCVEAIKGEQYLCKTSETDP